MKRFFESIFRNIPAKIASLLISIVIWVYVGSGFAQIGSFPGKIPIEIQNAPPGLVAVLEKEEVSVKIIAAASVWQKLDANSFNASIDLSGFTEGTYQIAVKVESATSGVRIVEINPSKVFVRLEKTAEKEVPINLQSEGKPAEGLALGDWRIEPDRVKISGASSVISKILEATAKVSLAGEKESFERIVVLEATDPDGNKIKNLTFNPAEVKVEVLLVQASSAKTVGIKVNTVGQPADGLWVSKIESLPPQVAVTAGAATISNVNFVETKEIDISGLDQSREFTTSLKQNPGVIILDNISVVKVKIFLSSLSSTRQFQIGYSWQNLNPGLKVASAEPAVSTLVLTGSTYDLSKLSAQDISININLSSLNRPGTYSIDISRSDVVLPPGISFSSIVPSAISVRLENL